MEPTQIINMDEPRYKISVAAEKLGITVHTLRMYEREGLIIPFKKDSSQRLYSDKDLERINCIRNAINEEKVSIQGIKRIFSLVPCWAIVKCSETDKANCEALNGHAKPCWMFKHKNNFCTGRECRECTVYNDYGNCGVIKEKLKELLL
jgi:MerR family transcriptional regulator/heat shock protein HspR